MGNCPLNRGHKQTSPPAETPVAPPAFSTRRQRSLMVSLQDFPCFGTAEFSLRLGESFSVVSDYGDYLMVKCARSGHEIYVPTRCTARVIDRWFFKGLSRHKAEELLMQPHNRTGAFIVRNSESHPDNYSLSILKRQGPTLGSVRHYRIVRLDNGWLYIFQKLTFSSLRDLVQHYTEFCGVLCCALEEPCFILGSDSTTIIPSTHVTSPSPMAVRRPTINWKDVSRSMLFRGKRAESEHSLVSYGLREAMSSYLYMTDRNGPEFI